MDTETATADPTTATVEGTSAPTITPEAEPAPVTEAAEEAPAAEEQKPTSSWATLTDPYEVLDLPDFSPVLERRDKRVRDQFQAEADQTVQEKTKQWESNQLKRSLDGYVGSITDAITNADVEGASRIMDKLETLMQPYTEEHSRTQLNAGARVQADAVKTALVDSLDRRAQDEYEEWIERHPGATWKTAIDEFLRMKVSAVETKYKAELQKRDDTIERMKTEGRSGQGPNLTPSASGGGRLYSQMTREERMALSPAERDALTAREMQGA